MRELRRKIESGKSWGIDAELISVKEAQMAKLAQENREHARRWNRLHDLAQKLDESAEGHGEDEDESSQEIIDDIDDALDSVNGYRSDLGAVQNRLDSSIGNMTAYTESLTAAASQIMDADYAHETAEMTRLQVMQQAGVAALAQARGINQSVISLLG